MGMPEDLKDIPEVNSVEVLRLNPGDALVIKCSHHLSDDSAARIRDMFENRFKDVPVIVLDCGMDIEVLRKS